MRSFFYTVVRGSLGLPCEGEVARQGGRVLHQAMRQRARFPTTNDEQRTAAGTFATVHDPRQTTHGAAGA